MKSKTSIENLETLGLTLWLVGVVAVALCLTILQDNKPLYNPVLFFGIFAIGLGTVVVYVEARRKN
jgi:FtsH-binding integral membrane protein